MHRRTILLPRVVKRMCVALLSAVQKTLMRIPVGEGAGLQHLALESASTLAAAVTGRLSVTDFTKEVRGIMRTAASQQVLGNFSSTGRSIHRIHSDGAWKLKEAPGMLLVTRKREASESLLRSRSKPGQIDRNRSGEDIGWRYAQHYLPSHGFHTRATTAGLGITLRTVPHPIIAVTAACLPIGLANSREHVWISPLTFRMPLLCPGGGGNLSGRWTC